MSENKVFLDKLKLRLWVDGLYKAFTKRRKQLSERRRLKLGLLKTVRRKGSKVYGNTSLKATQYLPGSMLQSSYAEW